MAAEEIGATAHADLPIDTRTLSGYDPNMGSFYKNKPCAYCGQITGKNEREHALSDCLYTSTVPGTIQRAMVSGCGDCNDLFQADEPYVKAILTACGENPGTERNELWEEVIRDIYRPGHGKARLEQIRKAMLPVKDKEGRPRRMIVPGKDEQVIRIVAKFVRGMCVYASGYGSLRRPLPFVSDNQRMQTVTQDRVWVAHQEYEIPAEFEAELKTVYEVPKICHIRACFQVDGMHSIWYLSLFRTRFMGAIDLNPNSELTEPTID
jgi:hypothetical protein